MKRVTLPDSEVLVTAEIAAAFRVGRNTVLRWAADGKLPSFRTPGGDRRFHRDDVQAFLNSPEAGR